MDSLSAAICYVPYVEIGITLYGPTVETLLLSMNLNLWKSIDWSDQPMRILTKTLPGLQNKRILF